MPNPLPELENGRTVCGEPLLERTHPVGCAALIAAYGLRVPPPDEMVAIGDRHTLPA